MTAQSIPGASAAPRQADRPLAGLGILFRKDVTEWVRGRRAWVIGIASVILMTLTAANYWITSRIAEQIGEGTEMPVGSVAPLDNLIAAIGTQVFVLATIFAIGSLIVAERQAGTLAWVASKPVSRAAIWLSKWLSATVMLAVSAVVVPVVATAAVVAALYGVPDASTVIGLVVGMLAVVSFYTAVGIAAGAILPGQPAVIAAVFGVFVLMPALPAVVPFDIAPFLPTAMLTWFAELGAGEAVSWVTPAAFVIESAAVAALGLNRMSRMEL